MSRKHGFLLARPGTSLSPQTNKQTTRRAVLASDSTQSTAPQPGWRAPDCTLAPGFRHVRNVDSRCKPSKRPSPFGIWFANFGPLVSILLPCVEETAMFRNMLVMALPLVVL